MWTCDLLKPGKDWKNPHQRKGDKPQEEGQSTSVFWPLTSEFRQKSWLLMRNTHPFATVPNCRPHGHKSARPILTSDPEGSDWMSGRRLRLQRTTPFRWQQLPVRPGTTLPRKTNKNVHFWQFHVIGRICPTRRSLGFHGDTSTLYPGRVHIHSSEFLIMLLNANIEPKPVSWPQRSSWDASSAKCRWGWGWASERWTTTGRAGWCSHSSCENAPLDTADGRRQKSEDRNQGLEIFCVLTDPLIVLLLLDLLHLIQELSHSQLQLSQLVLSCYFRVVIGVFSHLDVQMDSLEHQETWAVSGTGQAVIYVQQLWQTAVLCLWCPEDNLVSHSLYSLKHVCRSRDHRLGHTHQLCHLCNTLGKIGACDTSRTSIHPYQFPSCKQRHLGGVGVKTDLMFSRSVRGEGEAPVRAILTRQDDLSKVKNKSLAFILLNVTHQLIS